MYTYWTVGQLILNPEFLNKHGNKWRNFRVEVCHPNYPYSVAEYSFTVAQSKAASNFQDWLDTLETTEVLNAKELLKLFGEEVELLYGV